MELLVSLSSLLLLVVFAFWLLRAIPRGMVCHPSAFVGKTIDSRHIGRDTMGEPWCFGHCLLPAQGPLCRQDGSNAVGRVTPTGRSVGLLR